MQGRRNFLVAGILLTAYIALLLAATYYAQSELRDSATREIRLSLERRAASFSHFLTEAADDLSTLQAHPAVQGFFANKALGMSMRYGLRASLVRIDELFLSLLAKKRIGDGLVFQRLVLASEGTTLADTLGGTGGPPLPGELLAGTASGPSLLFSRLDGVRVALLTEPVYFRDKQAGVLIARINLQQAFDELVAPRGPDGDSGVSLVSNGLILASSGPEGPLTASLEDSSIHGARAETNPPPGKPPGSVDVRVPITGFALQLVGRSSMDELLGYFASKGFMFALGSLAILVIASVSFLFRTSVNHMVLTARVEESQEQQQRLNEQNRRLAREVSKRKEYEERLIRQANFDELTALPNRNLAMDRVSQAIKMAQGDGSGFAIMFLDLDRFKNVNDTLGHDAGDLLLTFAAQRLMRIVGSTDTVARLGGDEFLVLLPRPAPGQRAARMAEQILERFSRPFELNNRDVFVTMSIGIALFPEDGDTVQTLLQHADLALYDAKDGGKNSFRFYASAFNNQARERLAIESALVGGLGRREFSLAFQPMVNLDSASCVGAEALLRWRHPNLGPVAPSKFIPVAEDNGFIEALGEWVLREACREAVSWQRTQPCLVAVNVSSRQLRTPEQFGQLVEIVLQETGLEPRMLELEITEGTLLEEVPALSAMLARLSGLGVRLAVDDFGTGYSSLSYLKRFPFDKLKIDRAFIRDVLSDPGDAELTGAIIAMGKALGLQILGEGVETLEQAEFLRARGCHLAQGFLFSHPLPPDQMADLISAKARALDPLPLPHA